MDVSRDRQMYHDWVQLQARFDERLDGLCVRCDQRAVFEMADRRGDESTRHLEPLEQIPVCEECWLYMARLDPFDPRMAGPVVVCGRQVRSVYLAGETLFDGLRQSVVHTGMMSPFELQDPLYRLHLHRNHRWCFRSGNVDLLDDRVLVDRGPFFDDGVSVPPTKDRLIVHGYMDRRYSYSSERLDEFTRKYKYPHQYCMQAIDRSDLLFAWIEWPDCKQTLQEIARAASNPETTILIAGPRPFPELREKYQVADLVLFGDEAGDPHQAFAATVIDGKGAEYDG